MDGEDRHAGAVDSRALACPHVEVLRAFCVAVDCGSIGRAAQRLHLTQPAVSRRLKSLEETVGAPLLKRSSRGVSTTAAGERLYVHARRLISDMHALASVLDDIRDCRQTVRLAISHTAAELVMPRALVLMHHRTSAPVEVLVANSRVVKEMVAGGQADVGVAACMREEVVADLVSVALLDDEIVLAVPLRHPWARRRSVSPQELLRTPMVLRDPGAHTRQVVDETLSAHRMGALSAAAEAGSTQAAKEEAHELCVPTVMSRLALSPADLLEEVPIAGMRFLRRFCVLHQPGALTQDGRHLVESFQAGVSEAFERVSPAA